MGTLLALQLPPSLPQGKISHPEIFCLFPFYVSILSPTSFQGAQPAPHPPPEAWVLLLSPRGCFVGVVLYLDEFLMYLWGGWRSPCLNPPLSSSTFPFLVF